MSHAPAGGPPPWLNPEIQQRVTWRDDDIVISVPIKSGTTWTMNIVHQLLTGGDAAFEDIYAEVHWLELLSRPGQPAQEILDRADALPRTRPRAFKSHAAPPTLPYHPTAPDRHLKYIVVCRNPEEALVSAKPFFEKHTDAWFARWNMPKAALLRPDFPTFYREVIDPGQLQGMVFGFLAAWWPYRHRDNVLMLHYTDMTADHEGSIRRIARFLGVTPTAAQWPAISEYTSFAWMKAHEEKFEARTVSDIPLLESGAMVRKGKAGAASSDGMTPEIAAHLRTVGAQICPDPAAVEWCYRGGPLPA